MEQIAPFTWILAINNKHSCEISGPDLGGSASKSGWWAVKRTRVWNVCAHIRAEGNSKKKKKKQKQKQKQKQTCQNVIPFRELPLEGNMSRRTLHIISSLLLVVKC